MVLFFTLAPLTLYASLSLHFFRQRILHSSQMELKNQAKSLILLCEAQEALDRLKRISALPSPVDALSQASPSWIEANEYKSLKGIIKGIQVASKGFSCVFDRTGLLVVHPHREGENLFALEKGEGRDSLEQMRDRALSLPLGVIETVRSVALKEEDGGAAFRTRIQSFGYFKPYDWIVVVGAWEDDLLEPYYQGRRFFFLLLAGAGLISGLLAFFLSKYMMKPLVQLAGAASHLAQGEFHTVKPLESKDEMGRLTGEFNLMVDKLRQDQIEQAERKKELERRVRERTEDLQRASSQLVAIEKMVSLGKISAMVAHELNNPMSGILSYATYCGKILKDGAPDDMQSRELGECLDLISREAERCGKIINNLLVFSRKSYGEFTQAHLNEIVDRSVMIIDHSLRVREIALEKQLGAGDDLIWCDPSGLEQMFIALIINAEEAIEKKGKIVIRADYGRLDRVTFRISDTGRGIPPDRLPHIFQPFYSNKGGKVNAGLGLAVVFGIVQSHGGQIAVDSKVGEGTVFTVTLSRTPPEKPNVEASLIQGLHGKNP